MGSADVRAKPGMQAACKADEKSLCSDVTPGAGHMHACLRKNVAKITNPVCKAMVLETESLDNKSASINFAIRKDCHNERQAFCSDVPPGQARVLACLAQHLNENGFSDDCRESVNKADTQEAFAKAPQASSVEETKK